MITHPFIVETGAPVYMAAMPYILRDIFGSSCTQLLIRVDVGVNEASVRKRCFDPEGLVNLVKTLPSLPSVSPCIVIAKADYLFREPDHAFVSVDGEKFVDNGDVFYLSKQDSYFQSSFKKNCALYLIP